MLLAVRDGTLRTHLLEQLERLRGCGRIAAPAFGFFAHIPTITRRCRAGLITRGNSGYGQCSLAMVIGTRSREGYSAHYEWSFDLLTRRAYSFVVAERIGGTSDDLRVYPVAAV